MGKKQLEQLSSAAEEAHTNIQKDFADINPVIGISTGMRKVGIPADAMTIDCLKTGKRIIIIIHDKQPDSLQYQFSYKAQDPGESFENLAMKELNSKILYDWMKNYFNKAN